MSWDGPAVWYAAARWLGYLAVFIVVGAVVFRRSVAPRAAAPGAADPRASRRTVQLARGAAVLLALSLVARLYFQTRSLLEPEEAVTADLIRAVLASAWGKGWMAQAGATILTLVGWRALGRGSARGWSDAVAAIGAVAVVLTVPLTGHAVGLPAAGWIGYPLTVLHVGAGAAWIGTLGVALLTTLRHPRSPDGPSIASVVAAFSPVALVSGITVMAAGVIIGFRYVGTWDALFGTGYGRVLLVKIAALIGVAAIGAYNWRVLLPRLSRGEDAPVTRSASIEIAVGTALLAVTAVLVGMAAPGE
jgi:copper transport protein